MKKMALVLFLATSSFYFAKKKEVKTIQNTNKQQTASNKLSVITDPISNIQNSDLSYVESSEKIRLTSEEEIFVNNALGNKKKLNTINSEGYTPLMLAIERGDEKTAIRLLKKGADPTISGVMANALHLAASNYQMTVLKEILKTGVSPDLKYNPRNYNLLMSAATENNIEQVKILLQFGSNPLIQDRYGMRAVDYALREHNHKVINLLLSSLRQIDLQLYSQERDRVKKSCSRKNLTFCNMI